MKFRFAEAGDAASLATMNQELIRDEGHRNPMSLAQLERRMHEWLSSSYRAVVVSKDDADIGYALFQIEERGAWLRQLYVVQAWRRQGVGRETLTWLSKHAWPQSDRLRIEVLARNVEAQAFWRALGFEYYSITMEMSLFKL